MAMDNKYFLDDPFRELWPEKPEKYPYDLNTHPTARCAMALSAWNRRDEEEFQEHTRWVLDNMNRWTGGLEARFDWDVPGYKAKAPWISCMTQGMMLSVLARAGEKEAMEKAVWPFTEDIHRGGLIQVEGMGMSQYQGVPSKGMTDILNESLFAVIGLYEASKTQVGLLSAYLAMAKGQMNAAYALTQSKFDLKLPFFRWSKYDDGLYWYSGAKYHRVMVKQLEWLSERTGSPICGEWAEKWREWDEKYSGSRAEWFWLKVWRVYGMWLKWKHKRGWV